MSSAKFKERSTLAMSFGQAFTQHSADSHKTRKKIAEARNIDVKQTKLQRIRVSMSHSDEVIVGHSVLPQKRVTNLGDAMSWDEPGHVEVSSVAKQGDLRY